MKVPILSLTNNEIGKKELPQQFNEPVRFDLIGRAVLAIQANKRQPYGAKFEAGQRAVGKLSRRRRDYKGSYGIGISRVPRKIMSGKGSRWNWVGAVAPGTVGGRRAHPPKPSKDWTKKVNKKENRKAIRSALAAVMSKEFVKHVPENYPFIIETKFESLKKTKDVIEALIKLGFSNELERAEERTIRAGKGKMRGRKYRTKKSVLFVVSKKCELMSAANNILGSDIAEVRNINAELLAPGIRPRIVLFTEAAIDEFDKNKLFM
ncbi:MAG: 50S ribosomal protein L4 [Candidatus Woesearchaeota archaeon]|nr:50S ribosomal protein L4 [Candidatus Woesearchaeota archaeon]